MTSINPNAPAPNQQLAGILSSVPMPTPRPVPTDAASFPLAPGGLLMVGTPTTNVPVAGSEEPPAPGGITGGGDTPPAGAQPGAPTIGNAVATPVADSTPRIDAGPVTAQAAASSGFGTAERAKPMVVTVGDAKFSFPSFRAAARSNTAPEISWGAGWKRVESGGMW